MSLSGAVATTFIKLDMLWRLNSGLQVLRALNRKKPHTVLKALIKDPLKWAVNLEKITSADCACIYVTVFQQDYKSM